MSKPPSGKEAKSPIMPATDQAAVVAFAFGTPNTLRSNRHIAALASANAVALRAPIYTQRDVLPVAEGVVVELTAERPPERVPTLRIARGAVDFARRRGVAVLWLCAAAPHLPRCRRDLAFAIREAAAEIKLREVEDPERQTEGYWFCAASTQADTRSAVLWRLRDTVLMHMPMRLYASVAG
jgi:hypothetical protein